MVEWPESRRLASLYQSPGPAGIGFARYASSGFVSPELWENIRTTESLAKSNKGKPAVEQWTEDMVALRKALTEEGISWPLETVTFRWSTEHGRCIECGLPAWYRAPDRYGPDHDPEADDTLLCSACAAGEASHGERIVWLGKHDDEPEKEEQ